MQSVHDMNRAALMCIMDCIIYLESQGSSLRGHRDNMSSTDPGINHGNMRAMIEFRARTDPNLRSS